MVAGTKIGARPFDLPKTTGKSPPGKLEGEKKGEDVPMPQKVKADKLQKLNLMLVQAVAAMRVNEMLMRRLLRWAASQSDDPRGFIRETVEKTRNELQQESRADDHPSSMQAAEEALRYLDDLATEMQVQKRPKSARAEPKGLTLLERLHFPSFTSAQEHARNDTSRAAIGRR
jgi:hypothetical protein